MESVSEKRDFGVNIKDGALSRMCFMQVLSWKKMSKRIFENKDDDLPRSSLNKVAVGWRIFVFVGNFDALKFGKCGI